MSSEPTDRKTEDLPPDAERLYCRDCNAPVHAVYRGSDYMLIVCAECRLVLMDLQYDRAALN